MFLSSLSEAQSETPEPLNLDVSRNSATTFGFGTRTFLAVHRTKFADFSAGPGVSMIHSTADRRNDVTLINLEVVAQIRAFIVENVAISGSLEVEATLGDATAVSVTGNLLGSFGMTYFF